MWHPPSLHNTHVVLCSRIFFDKQMSHEVEADALGDEFKGYVFKIAGGNDKQGFPMMQGVHVNGRVRLLLKKGNNATFQVLALIYSKRTKVLP